MQAERATSYVDASQPITAPEVLRAKRPIDHQKTNVIVGWWLLACVSIVSIVYLYGVPRVLQPGHQW